MKTETNLALEMSDMVLDSSRDINHILSDSKQVSPMFHAHYANMESGDYGIEDLIISILKEKEATFPAGVESTDLRPIAVASSLYTDEIFEEVQRKFTAGSIRYPLETIKTFLSVFMRRKINRKVLSTPIIGKIQLSTSEDKNRSCRKPRCKWYLISQ